MNLEDMILVSVDDHVVEPAHMFEGRLPKKYEEAAPRFVRTDDGINAWQYDGVLVPNFGLNAVAGRPPEEYGLEPTAIEEIRDGCYDIDHRIQDMNANGVLGSLCFPSFVQFCGQLLSRTKDKDQALAMIRAYNDWHVDEWCGTYPGRFIPLGLLPLWDANLMADEVKRLAQKGCHAVSFSENPSLLRYESLHHETWNPFWEACDEHGTVVCLHIGSSSKMPITAADAPIDVLITLSPINIVQAASDLIWSRILRDHPNLKIALSEGGIGWIPYFLERIDFVYQQHRAWTNQDFGSQLPSEVFRDRVITCFIDDQFGLESRSRLNMDNVTWECDYPHSDSTWPRSPEALHTSLASLSDDEINRVTHQNAMRLFQFDPFASRPRAECTVAALRAASSGWDVATVSRGEARASRSTLAADLMTANRRRPVEATP
ncbi:MAG: hypothetical protein QOI95_2010 [Acidimicrobiaceae bacterium]|jgi:predicted TIM-barrel fold metal-dependent hydrolase